MKEHTPTGTLHCYWSNLKEHPKCIHGPSLLFGREVNGEVTKFYACSACRDRKICAFYAEHGKELNKQDELTLKKQKKKNLPTYHHQKLFITFNQLMSQSTLQRAYCHTCEKLFSISEKEKHKDHEILENISDYQMTHPTEILKPLENSKKEAQYLFSKKAVKDIVDLLISLNAENILCIGAPRIHEYISHNFEGKMSSLLLDFDARFHNFFGPLNYCWYNLFNHHFFQENSKDVFQEFLKQGKNMYLVCDPPFGGRVEPISQTLKCINDLHKKLNKISDFKDELKIFFIFPYYMEAIMKEKSNPPDISGGLKELKMTDYKVEYDNHPLFVSKSNNEKQGSQVRIFTNVSLDLIKLPEEDGYKYCKRCNRWVAQENKHCKICHSCTSKDGRRYRHCKQCQRCVKPTWEHCRKCNRCTLPVHKCGQKPNIGKCFKCNKTGHTEKECSQPNSASPNEILRVKKRKSAIKTDSTPEKKPKVEPIILPSKKGKIRKDGLENEKMKKVSSTLPKEANKKKVSKDFKKCCNPTPEKCIRKKKSLTDISHKSKKRKFNGAKNRTDGKLSSHTIHDDESTKENSEIKKPMKKLIK